MQEIINLYNYKSITENDSKEIIEKIIEFFKD